MQPTSLQAMLNHPYQLEVVMALDYQQFQAGSRDFRHRCRYEVLRNYEEPHKISTEIHQMTNKKGLDSFIAGWNVTKWRNMVIYAVIQYAENKRAKEN